MPDKQVAKKGLRDSVPKAKIRVLLALWDLSATENPAKKGEVMNTIRECYRIMGFPEDFQRDPNLGESYKQIGNSVCVPMVEAIAQEIMKQHLS